MKYLIVLFVAALGLAHAVPLPTTDAEKRRASYECQRAAIARNKGLVLPSATCACNAKVGLPEYPSCRALRAPKGGAK